MTMYGSTAGIAGRRALVTGATSGIGAAIAEALAAAGAHVVRHGLDGDLKHDLTRRGAGERLAQAAGVVDVLVHAASIQERSPWWGLTDESIERQVCADLVEPFALIRGVLPGMIRARRGRVVVLGSVQRQRPHPDMLAYAASKAGLHAVTQGLSQQVAAAGVTINTLAPGVVETPRNQEALSEPGYREAVLAQIPSRRLGAPADCVGAALLLCSDAGSYITGQEIVIDGGWSST